MVFLLRGTGLVPQLGLTSYSRSANAGEATSLSAYLASISLCGMVSREVGEGLLWVLAVLSEAQSPHAHSLQGLDCYLLCLEGTGPRIILGR